MTIGKIHPTLFRTEKLKICFQDQWHRLFNKKTLASSRREIFHHDKCAPNDYLDFELKSVYDHHNQFMRGNNEVMYQNETFGNPDMRQLKNRAQKSNIVDPRESSDGLGKSSVRLPSTVRWALIDFKIQRTQHSKWLKRDIERIATIMMVPSHLITTQQPIAVIQESTTEEYFLFS